MLGEITLDKEQLIKLAEGLYQEAFDANAYFLIMRQYGKMEKEYRPEMSLSPAFYSVVYEALQRACFIELAKLYDRTKGAYSIGTMLNFCKDNLAFFSEYRDTVEIEDDGKKYVFPVPYQHNLKPAEERFFKEEVRTQRDFYKIFDTSSADTAPVTVELTFSQFLELYQKRYSSLSKKRENMSEQRNKIYAHNDRKGIFNQEEILEKNPLFYTDMQELIEFALDAAGLIVGALTGICKARSYANIDDWEGTLMLARLGLKYQGYDQEQKEKAFWEEFRSKEKRQTE